MRGGPPPLGGDMALPGDCHLLGCMEAAAAPGSESDSTPEVGLVPSERQSQQHRPSPPPTATPLRLFPVWVKPGIWGEMHIYTQLLWDLSHPAPLSFLCSRPKSGNSRSLTRPRGTDPEELPAGRRPSPHPHTHCRGAGFRFP